MHLTSMILAEKGTILQVTEHGGTRCPSESDSGEARSNCPPHSECGEASSPLPTPSGSGRVHPETPLSRLDSRADTVHLESPSSPLPNPGSDVQPESAPCGSATGGRGPSPLAKEQPPLLKATPSRSVLSDSGKAYTVCIIITLALLSVLSPA